MHDVSVSLPVKATRAFTIAFLHTYVKQHRRTAAGAQLVTVDYLCRDADQPAHLLIRWNGGDVALASDFAGTISTDSSDTDDCRLTIECSSETEAGTVFDPETFGYLAQEFRDAVERDYRERLRLR